MARKKMEFLKKQSDYVAAQLRSLSSSQRIAIGLLLVLVVGGMYQMITWAQQAEWSPVIDQALTAAEIQQIETALAMVGIESRVEQDRILIRGGDDDRRRAQAVLAERNALPQETHLGFTALFDNNNSFISNKKQDWLQQRALETELSRVIGKFRGIRQARVFVQVPRKRGFGSRSKTGASASVHVTLGAGATLPKRQVSAIASYVAGAVETLSPNDVNITDGSRYYRAPEAGSPLSSDLLERQRANEDHYTRMIYDQFRHIDGLVANVRVKFRDVDEQVQDRVLGDPKPLLESEENLEEKNTISSAAPGVQPNQGAVIGDAASGDSSSKTMTETQFDPNRDSKETKTRIPIGYVQHLTASISVPHTYLERVYRKQKGKTADQEVTPEELDAVAKVHLTKVHDSVQTLLYHGDFEGGKAKVKQVAVDWFYDFSDEEQAIGVMEAGTDYVALAKDYGPQAGLGLLALVSLLGVFKMAKNAQAAVAASQEEPDGDAVGAAIAAGASAGDISILGGGPNTIGQAEGMHSAMVGHEVDENLVRTQQIVDQIGELVNEDPASAANIVQAWMQDEK